MAIDFLKLLETLADTGLEFVIVGGVAARLHGSERLTHDVDVVPALDAQRWSNAVDALWKGGARPRIPEPLERVRDVAQVERWIHEKGMVALSFRSADGFFEVDLLVGEARRFEELRARAIDVAVGGRTYYVAHIDDLIAMKRAAGRPQDLLDVEALERVKRRTTP
jgi:predicted nucleotidyltransferase